MNKQSSAKTSDQVDTQPQRVKKQQQKYLAWALLSMAVMGWAVFSWVSGSSSTTLSGARTNKNEIRTSTAVRDPLSHVNEESVWVERVQNELRQSQKTTDSLQQQLQLLAQAKAAQEQATQSQTEVVHVLQAQVRELQNNLNSKNTLNFPANSGSVSNTALPAHHTTGSGMREDSLALSPTKPDSALPLRPSKTPDTFVPAGTFVRAVMLGGADAPAGVTSQSNPTPVLLRLLDPGTLPNRRRSHLRDCVATAAVMGDISSERGQMRLERLSCVSPGGEVVEMPVEGTVFGPEGKNGVRGIPLWREGALLKRAFVAGTLSGLSQGISNQYTTTTVSPSGTVSSVNNSDIFKYGAAQGVSNAMDKIADYNIRRADQYHPVIQLSAGTLVDVVFLKGFYLDGEKHDHDAETILPPFAPLSAFPVQRSASVAVPAKTNTLSSSAPLPLTQAQIDALKSSIKNQSSS